MTIPDSAYDIMLDGKGYLLLRGDAKGQGPRGWKETALGSSNAQQSAVEQQYGNLPTTVSAPMAWRSCDMGYGDRRQRADRRYYYAENVDCRIFEQIIPGPKVTLLDLGEGAVVTHLVEYDGVVMAIAGGKITRIESDLAIVPEKDMGETRPAVDAVVFNGALYVSTGTTAHESYPLWKRWPSGDWTPAPDVHVGFMAVWKDRLWAQMSTTLDTVTTINGVQNCAADPMVASNWSSNGPIVGDPGTPITSMGSLGDMLYVGKQDGLHGVDASDIAPLLTPEIGAFRSEFNCLNMRAWHGIWFVPHVRGLLLFQDRGDAGFLIADAGPGREADTENPVRGQITAMAGDDHWLYVALYSVTGDSYILAGREAVGEEVQFGRMVWHPLATIPDSTCGAMLISGLSDTPRLFFGVGPQVGYITLPRSADNPLADTQSRYATAGSLYLPAHSWNAPTTRKVWREVRFDTRGLSISRRLQVFYSLDDGAWTPLGLVNISPTQRLAFPDGGARGNSLRLRIDYVGSEQRPFVIQSILAVGAERPATLKQYTANIRCATKLPLRTGGTCPRTAAQIRDALYALGDHPGSVEMIDPLGRSRWVLVQPGVSGSESLQEGCMDREMVFTLNMTDFEDDAIAPAATGDQGVYGTTTYGNGDIYA